MAWVDPAPVLDWIALERARGVSLMSIARTSGVHRSTFLYWRRGHAAQDAIVDRFAVNVGRPSLYYACQGKESE